MSSEGHQHDQSPGGSACCGPAASRPATGLNAAGQSAEPELLSIGRPARGVGRLLRLDGGTFLMGSEDPLAYPLDLEGPVRAVTVDPFEIGETAVTVAEFAEFVTATGYVSDAERFGDSLVFAGLLAADAPPTRAVAQTPWWRVVPGASWKHPEGPGSDVAGRGDHPVTQVSQADAQAYAQWAGGRLPTESEWEFASRGGLAQQPFPWGSEREPGGRSAMKIFEGEFPYGPSAPVGTVPARSYEPNGFGLYATTGNVWEWTASTFAAYDPRPVVRGGSFMCHESYCRRYRTSARTANTPDSSLSHTGFRLAR